MPFEILQPGRSKRAEGADIIVSADATSVRVVLAAAFVQRMQWHPGDQLQIHLGTGADAGCMLLSGVESGGWTLSAAGGKRADLRLRLRRWDGVPERLPAIGIPADQAHGGKGAIFRLPWVTDNSEGEDVALCERGDTEYRAAKRLLRRAGMEVTPAQSGTRSQVDGKWMTRDEVVALAQATDNSIDQHSVLAMRDQ